jgi:hypothetical protein
MRAPFLAAGFDVTSTEIKSIMPGDSIELRDGRAITVRQRDKVVDAPEVSFDREEKRVVAGFPATYHYYLRYAPKRVSV